MASTAAYLARADWRNAPKMRTVLNRAPNGTFVDQKQQGFDLGPPLYTHEPFPTIPNRDPNGCAAAYANQDILQHHVVDTLRPNDLTLQQGLDPALGLAQRFANPFFVPYAYVDRF
ncbi:MAG: hypothetical protein EOP01_03995 [Propionibacteriaceae bacterium]|nr:MAG: hypothetical protein EOP01_03995 [Propionibacteriaceae bacterium]